MYVDERLKLYINKWVVDRVSFFRDLLYFQIHITNRCGNHCKHCYFREIPTLGDINLSECSDFILNCKALALRKNKRLKIDFIGGDPLLYPHLTELSRLCVREKIEYGLKCNPNEIVNNWAAVEETVLNCSDVMLSLDGLEQTNDSIRSSGSFQLTLKAMNILKRYKKIVRIHFTASKSNYNEIVPLLRFLLHERFIIDDFTWGRYWSEVDNRFILSEEEMIGIFSQQIEFLNNMFKRSDFFYINDDGHCVPKLFFSFKEHLWIPFFIENNILYDDVVNYILPQSNCLNCTATKDIYIVDQKLQIFNCRKKMTINNHVDKFFSGEQKRMEFRDFLCNDCLYANVCKSCYAIHKKLCPYFNRRN